MRLPSIRLWLATLTCALLAACGSGDNSSTSASSQTVVATGAITGFGSVYVNGIHFETTGTSFWRDGTAATQGDLRVGHMIEVTGHVDSKSGRAVADTIHQHDSLEGPISAIDTTAQTFTVLAHVVKVTTDTSFDDSLGSFAALTVGTQVEVSGTPDASGAIVATRVEPRRAGETHLELLGKISALNTTTLRFNIDQLVVDYSAAVLHDFGTTTIANGQSVEVKGSAVTNGVLVATEVELHDVEHGEGEHVQGEFRRELEGLVTRFVSATDFDIAGRAVTTTSSTVFEGGAATDLALNVKIEAEGEINTAGVLVAAKVEFKRSSNAGLAGLVQAVSADATGLGGTLTVMGVTITVDNNTRVEDKSDAHVQMFHVANIAAGDYVEIRGTEPSALHLTASRLERRRARSDIWVRGTARDLVTPNFTVLGVPAVTNGSTHFHDLTATQFFASGAGLTVKVQGSFINNVLTASDVQPESDEDHEGSDD